MKLMLVVASMISGSSLTSIQSAQNQVSVQVKAGILMRARCERYQQDKLGESPASEAKCGEIESDLM